MNKFNKTVELIINEKAPNPEEQIKGMVDKDKNKINIGDTVLYQVDTKNESEFELYVDGKGYVRFNFPNGDGHDMQDKKIKEVWYNKSDKLISKVIKKWLKIQYNRIQ